LPDSVSTTETPAAVYGGTGPPPVVLTYCGGGLVVEKL